MFNYAVANSILRFTLSDHLNFTSDEISRTLKHSPVAIKGHIKHINNLKNWYFIKERPDGSIWAKFMGDISTAKEYLDKGGFELDIDFKGVCWDIVQFLRANPPSNNGTFNGEQIKKHVGISDNNCWNAFNLMEEEGLITKESASDNSVKYVIISLNSKTHLVSNKNELFKKSSLTFYDNRQTNAINIHGNNSGTVNQGAFERFTQDNPYAITAANNDGNHTPNGIFTVITKHPIWSSVIAGLIIVAITVVLHLNGLL